MNDAALAAQFRAMISQFTRDYAAAVDHAADQPVHYTLTTAGYRAAQFI